MAPEVTPTTLLLRKDTVTELQRILPDVAEGTVSAIIDDVPSYSDALSGPMGETIRVAVETALGGFVQLAARSQGERAQQPPAVAVDGAYQLGRGEARSGRTVDALLSAYRIGARVAWREMSATAVRNGTDAGTLGRFAELVFAYIDELSASSVAGHNDELATTGRVRQRLLERVAAHLLHDSAPEVVETAADPAADVAYDAQVVDEQGRASATFPWAEVGREALGRHAAAAGLRVSQTWSVGRRTFCRLVRAS